MVPVVATMRKLRANATSKASTRYDSIKNNPEPAKIYDAAGAGRAGLTFEKQGEAQLEIYKRTLTVSSLFIENLAQELRQTQLRDETLHLTVSVAREDFPSVSADVKITYLQSAMQAAWRVFLVDVRLALKVDFIESILDRMDLAPINRLVSLRDGGQYFCKQREASAILEVIESGKLPQQVSWPITQGINVAKSNLLESGMNQTLMDKRIDAIIKMPMIRENQRETCFALLDAANAQEILSAMDAMMHAVDLPPDELKIALTKKAQYEEEARLAEEARVDAMNAALARGATAAELLAFNSAEAIKAIDVPLKTYDREVDIVLLHRVALESLSRLVMNNPEALMDTAHMSFEFIEQTLVRFRDEIDIVLMAVKLLGELCEYLLIKRRAMYIVIFDTVQCYAPPPLFYLPRIVHRLLSPEELAEEERIFNSQFVMDDDDDMEPVAADEANVEARLQRQLEAMGVRVIEGEPEVVDDDSTVDEAQEEEEEEQDEEMVEEVVDDVLVLRPGEKKPWKCSVGFTGKPYRKKLSERDDASFDELFGGDDDVPTVPGLTKKKNMFKPAKFTLRPLPWTKGIIHRGFNGNQNYKNGMILQQCFATVYKLLVISFGYREQAFDLFLHEEVADVAVVSVGSPRLLEYVVWIIDVMYMDGFAADTEDEVTVDPSMQLSVPRADDVSSRGAGVGGGGNNGMGAGGGDAGEGDDVSIDPVTGMIINAVSTVTQPSVDLDGLNREVPAPEVNLGDPKEEYERWTAGPIKREDESVNITVSICLDPEAKEREELAKKIAAGVPGVTKLLSSMGERAFNRRYRGRPKDIVIIALALISQHCDLAPRDRELAKKWLSVFDDCSPSFRFLVRRGEGLNC